MTKQDQFLIDQLNVYKNLRSPEQPTVKDVSEILSAFHQVFGFGKDEMSTEVPWFKIAKENSAPISDYSGTGNEKSYLPKTAYTAEQIQEIFGCPTVKEMEDIEGRMQAEYIKNPESMLNLEQAAKVLGITMISLCDKSRSGEIPCLRLDNGELLFNSRVLDSHKKAAPERDIQRPEALSREEIIARARQRQEEKNAHLLCGKKPSPIVVETPACKCQKRILRPRSEIQNEANRLCAYFHGCKKGFSFKDARRVLGSSLTKGQFQTLRRRTECAANGKKFIIHRMDGTSSRGARYQVVEIHKS